MNRKTLLHFVANCMMLTMAGYLIAHLLIITLLQTSSLPHQDSCTKARFDISHTIIDSCQARTTPI